MSLLDENFAESFLRGFSSVWDISPRIELPERMQCKTLEESLLVDTRALESDFKKFSKDMDKAVQDL
jgi:hypothetical protein